MSFSGLPTRGTTSTKDTGSPSTTMEFTEGQWALLKDYEDRNYVDFIRGHIVRDYPALANDPALRDRLNAAFAQTKMLRFTHDGPIVDFLYVEATTPGFYWIPEVIAWLHKPGVPAEQRFEMLMQATRKGQQEMKEKR